jgi:uncharacterized membrane protein YjfL (UPF0719 family)
MLLTFFVLFALFYFGIEAFNKMTKSEKWDAIKTGSYSLALSLLVIVVLTTLVVLF